MLMKVFNKGQVVIPSSIRRILGIHIGDMVDIEMDVPKDKIRIKKPAAFKSGAMAGCFAKYREKNKVKFPTRTEMEESFAEGLLHEK